MSFETAGTFNPAIKNPGSSATGLIQFMDATAKGLGTSTEELSKMSRAQQLLFVEKHMSRFAGSLNTLSDVYMSVLWPAAVGKPESFPLFVEGTENYEKNKGLDSNGDGTVTKAEATGAVTGSNAGGGTVNVPTVTTTPLGQNETGFTDIRERSLANPEILATGPTEQGLGGTGGQGESVTQQGQEPSRVEQENPRDRDSTRQLARQQTAEALSKLQRADRADLTALEVPLSQVPQFDSEEEMVAAIEAGTISEGDVAFVDGVAMKARKRGQ